MRDPQKAAFQQKLEEQEAKKAAEAEVKLAFVARKDTEILRQEAEIKARGLAAAEVNASQGVYFLPDVYRLSSPLWLVTHPMTALFLTRAVLRRASWLAGSLQQRARHGTLLGW